MAQSAHFNYSLSWKEVQAVKSSPVEIVVLGIPKVHIFRTEKGGIDVGKKGTNNAFYFSYVRLHALTEMNHKVDEKNPSRKM